MTKHAAEQMALHKVTARMIEVALAKGERFWDPLGKTYIYILRRAYQTKGGAQDLLIAKSPTCKRIVTVIVGNRVERPRFVPVK
ncbi:MAG: hypothetical protein AMXMBFR61_04170 [Fimbriimonadales bacterium]